MSTAAALPADSPAALYATDPNRTVDGATRILRAEIEHALDAARLTHDLVGPFEGSAQARERLELIQIRLLEIKMLTRRL